ncbi:hypothetical protein GWK47_034171 [Chionoecetes opilio]|uniref:Uncharacterized protein n=1 Tax=Chionoecetes opilio TaxID=41210 RepID=A0A8J4YIK4_CHIOP|nr:hypothetical protein GWK47_034171 [Chionoecetes opilio]
MKQERNCSARKTERWRTFPQLNRPCCSTPSVQCTRLASGQPVTRPNNRHQLLKAAVGHWMQKQSPGFLSGARSLRQQRLDTVDGLAKAACGLPPNGNGPSPSLLCYRARLRSDALLSTARSRDTQRGDSVSIQHYDIIRAHRYKYRRRGLMVRRHNVVSARLRLGYRPVWQVAGMAEEPHFTSCQLCDAPSSNTLAHYCLHCHVVRDMLPRGLSLTEICRFLLVHDNLDTIFVRHPRFGGC